MSEESGAMGSLSPTKGVGIFVTLEVVSSQLTTYMSRQKDELPVAVRHPVVRLGYHRANGRSSPLQAPASAPVEHCSKFTLMVPPLMTASASCWNLPHRSCKGTGQACVCLSATVALASFKYFQIARRKTMVS